MKTFFTNHKYGLLLLVIVAVCALTGIGGPLGLTFAFAGVTTTDLTGGHKGIPANRTAKGGTIRQRITIPLALQVASDIVKLMNVKAGWLVKQVHIFMVTPSTGTTLTANIGDGDTAAGFDSAMSLKGAAGTRTYGIDGTDAHITSGGKYYAADDTIDLAFATVSSPVGDVVFDVVAEVKDLNA
jgi:hypothetical protein